MSGRRFVISDMHFGHENIISLASRPFTSVDEMDAAMIQRWRDAVTDNDLVYCLGDVGHNIQDVKVLHRLPGVKHLIVGNHDDLPKICATGIFQNVSMWAQLHEEGVLMTHLPVRRQQMKNFQYNLHGHVHNNSGGLEIFHVNMSVEVWDYRPTPLDVILRKVSMRTELDFV